MASNLFPAYEASRFTIPGPYGLALELLRLDHSEALAAAAAQGEAWRNPYVQIPHPEQVQGYVQSALNDVARGQSRVFVGRWAGQVVGSVRFFLYFPLHRRVQVGGLWVAHTARGTGITRLFTTLLLREAFEVMRCQRVEFTAHPENFESQNLLKRVGAVYEGRMRKHLWDSTRTALAANGAPRDSLLFSLTDDDWARQPAQHLDAADVLTRKGIKRQKQMVIYGSAS